MKEKDCKATGGMGERGRKKKEKRRRRTEREQRLNGREVNNAEGEMRKRERR